MKKYIGIRTVFDPPEQDEPPMSWEEWRQMRQDEARERAELRAERDKLRERLRIS